MNVTCDGDPFFIKWENDEFLDFEDEPGAVPSCGDFSMIGLHVFGGIGNGGLGFSVEIQPDGTAIITVPLSCTVQLVAVKGDQLCDVFVPPGGSFTVSCPGLNIF